VSAAWAERFRRLFLRRFSRGVRALGQSFENRLELIGTVKLRAAQVLNARKGFVTR
jgi:hypothetical protein